MAPASKMQWQGRQRKRVLLILFFLMREECKESCPTLCDPIDGSPPGSPFPGILQARTLEWVAISFSNARKLKVKVKLLSHVRLLATPWSAAYQAPLSMGFSRQEYSSGLPLSLACRMGSLMVFFYSVTSSPFSAQAGNSSA